MPHIHWLNLDFNEIFNMLNNEEFLKHSSILKITPVDCEKIKDIKEKKIFQEIMGSSLSDCSKIGHYQISRWRKWIQILQSFEQHKKKYELDCLEDITKKCLIEIVFYKINEQRWI